MASQIEWFDEEVDRAFEGGCPDREPAREGARCADPRVRTVHRRGPYYRLDQTRARAATRAMAGRVPAERTRDRIGAWAGHTRSAHDRARRSRSHTLRGGRTYGLARRNLRRFRTPEPRS